MWSRYEVTKLGRYEVRSVVSDQYNKILVPSLLKDVICVTPDAFLSLLIKFRKSCRRSNSSVKLGSSSNINIGIDSWFGVGSSDEPRRLDSLQSLLLAATDTKTNLKGQTKDRKTIVKVEVLMKVHIINYKRCSLKAIENAPAFKNCETLYKSIVCHSEHSSLYVVNWKKPATLFRLFSADINERQF